MTFRLLFLFLFNILMSVNLLFAGPTTLQQFKLAQTDTGRVRLLCDASFEYLNTHVDSAMYFAQEALRISMNNENADGKSRSLNAIGNVLLQTGQHDKALETYLSALKIAEQSGAESRIAQTYSNIGNLYINQGEYRLPLDYLFKAKAINEKSGDYDKLTINLVNIGICYQYQDMFDSALYYLNHGLDITMNKKLTEYECSILFYIGTVYNDQHNSSIAKRYFFQSIEKAKASQNQNILSSALQGLGRILKNEHSDSSLYYANLAYEIAARNNYYVTSMNSATSLYELYLAKGEKDSSLKYLKIRYDLKDSLFNYEKTKHIQTLTLQEGLRQDEIKLEKEKQQKERMQNIQYIGIAAFILSLFIILIIMSRKKIKPQIIEFLGLIALLLFFEFISLVLHPYIEQWSHHRPIFTLLILVCLASILVPSHYKLEKFIKEKLVKPK